MQYLVSVIDDTTGPAPDETAEGSKHCNRKIEVRPVL